jgi:molybdate transport system substrate-binding protein
MRTLSTRFRSGLLVASLLALVACGNSSSPAAEAKPAAPAAAKPAAPAAPLTIAAAASLRELLEGASAEYASSHGGSKPSFSFEASSTLSRKIEEGGAFDAFLSADAANVDRLKDKVDVATRRVFLGNKLVMVGRSDLPSPPADPAALAAGKWSIALAGPAVPAGKYARAYFEKKGLTAALTPRVTNADDVRAALALVEAGTVDTAFVYLTDAKIAKNAKLLWTAPAEDDPGISYVAAVVHGGKPDAAKFVEWLGSEAFLKQAEALGFLRPVH